MNFAQVPPDPDSDAIALVRGFLSETMYALVDFRLSFEAPTSPTGFPRFERLQAVAARLDASTRTIFQLFRLGETVDDASVRQSIPSGAIAAMTQLGVLQRSESGGWRTPDLLLVPIEGIFLFVGTPPSYPTATRPADVWFDLSSYVLAKSLPATLAGARVLDLCCGSGVLGILCTLRGARTALGLDISEAATRIAALNAALNGVGDRIRFRQSDRTAALAADERFDFVTCNTPHAPVVGESPAALALERIGNLVLTDMIDDIPAHMSPDGRGILAIWRAAGQGGRTAQHDYLADRLAAHAFATRAFVERAPDTAEGVLQILAADAEQRFGSAHGAALATQVADLLAHAAIDGFYNQVIAFGRDGRTGTGTFGLDLAHAPVIA